MEEETRGLIVESLAVWSGLPIGDGWEVLRGVDCCCCVAGGVCWYGLGGDTTDSTLPLPLSNDSPDIVIVIAVAPFCPLLPK